MRRTAARRSTPADYVTSHVVARMTSSHTPIPTSLSTTVCSRHRHRHHYHYHHHHHHHHYITTVFNVVIIITCISHTQSMNEWMNQSVIQAVGQSVSQSAKQSINQSINQSVSQAINQSINQSINQLLKTHLYIVISLLENQRRRYSVARRLVLGWFKIHKYTFDDCGALT